MKRALALLAPAVLVVGLVACGGDDDTPDTTAAAADTTTTDSTVATPATDGDDTEAGGSVGGSETDMMQQIFPNLDGDQLQCLVDNVGDSAATMSAAEAQAIADDCGIDPADLTPDMSAISIPDLSGVSMPDNMGEMITQIFPGLSEEQADCLVDQLGGDFDMSKAAELADTCNIDPADLTPG